MLHIGRNKRIYTPLNQTHLPKLGCQTSTEVELGSEDNKDAEIDETEEHTGVCSAFPVRRHPTTGLDLGSDVRVVEHGLVNDVHVLCVVQVRSDKEAGEVESGMTYKVSG
jgi:hypothetical protein